MLKTISFIALLILPFLGFAQTTYSVRIDYNQTLQNSPGAAGNIARLPNDNATLIMGGLNNLNGLGNYFNVYGSKLIIERSDRGTDGTTKVVLRREDGKNFFDVFPTITATLTPLEQDFEKNAPLNGTSEITTDSP